VGLRLPVTQWGSRYCIEKVKTIDSPSLLGIPLINGYKAGEKGQRPPEIVNNTNKQSSSGRENGMRNKGIVALAGSFFVGVVSLGCSHNRSAGDHSVMAGSPKSMSRNEGSAENALLAKGNKKPDGGAEGSSDKSPAVNGLAPASLGSPTNTPSATSNFGIPPGSTPAFTNPGISKTPVDSNIIPPPPVKGLDTLGGGEKGSNRFQVPDNPP
jgi:hypothetical protein